MEFPEDGLAREHREELGVHSVVGDRLAEHRFEFPGETLVVILFRVVLVGEPRPLAAEELRWVEWPDAIETLPLQPTLYIWSPIIEREVGQPVARRVPQDAIDAARRIAERDGSPSTERVVVVTSRGHLTFLQVAFRCSCSHAWPEWIAREHGDLLVPTCPRCGTKVWP